MSNPPSTPSRFTPIPATGLGHQFIGDIYECQADINDQETVRNATLNAAKIGNATIVKEVTHEYAPHGLSCVLVISESHIALHTWPEYGYVSVDIFSCDLSVDGEKIIASIKADLQATSATTQKVHRGLTIPT